jgi:hypothetical protein
MQPRSDAHRAQRIGPGLAAGITGPAAGCDSDYLYRLQPLLRKTIVQISFLRSKPAGMRVYSELDRGASTFVRSICAKALYVKAIRVRLLHRNADRNMRCSENV